MKPTHLKVLRVLAVLSSVSLLGIYVSCRARERTASPAVVAEPAPQPTEQPPQVVPEHDRDVFVGTKSAEVFPAPKTTPRKEEPRHVMPGSKSLAPLLPSHTEPPQQPAQPAPQQTQAPK